MRRTSLSASLLTALAIAAPASASTLGSSGIAATGDCGSDIVVWETDSAYTVPAGGGVITSMATNTPTAGKHITLKVVRPSGGGVTVVASSPVITEVAGVNRVTMNVPVQAGDMLGFYSSDGADCAITTSGGGSVAVKSAAGGDPAVGAQITPSAAGAAQLALEATFEPDADHDGFGDETQDSCPADPAIHEGSCVVDLGAALTAVPSKIGVGDVSVLTATVNNASTGTGQGITMLTTPSPGLSIVTTSLGSACTFAGALSCPLGSLAGGASQAIIIVVKGTARGAQKVTVGLTTSGTDPNTANNTANQPITVERRQAVKCRVPKLTGLTKPFAKTLLKAVNCKLGKATKKASAKGRSGTVIKQSVKAGKVRPAGSKVNVTLKK
jgi:hypothetical protein